MIITLRSIIDCPGKPFNADSHPDTIVRSYKIHVVTPIFGGGVKAGESDPVTAIRPSSIRGHLRFWWRATRGTKFDTVLELRTQEGKIWGTTDNPSKVALEVNINSQGKIYPCAYFPEDKNFPRFEVNHPSYALFPFQGNKRERIPPAKCTSNVSFELKLTYPQNLSHDVGAAVWAWTSFGGIGARVRRGCGALRCEEMSPERESLNSWYRSSLEGFSVDLSRSHNWPTLPDRFLIRANGNNVMQGWADVVGLMQTFRQGQGVGRNPGSSPNRPGRSRWPEPESIRQATSSRSARHSRMPTIPNNAFPRAEFGLPIVFHFKDNGDPKDTELYPVTEGQKKTRMASPLILRPMICKNGEVLQLILKLKTAIPDEVVLEKAPGSPTFKKISDPTLTCYPNSPLGSPRAGLPARSPSGSSLEGFLAFAKENGYMEVI